MGNDLWVYGHGICWCPNCGVTVESEQKHCLVCGYGVDVTDKIVGGTGYYERDYSGLTEE